MDHESRTSIVDRMVLAGGIPVSQGSVTASSDDGTHTKIKLRVKLLAPPVRPDPTLYVVWLEHATGPRANLGTLSLDDDLAGTLEAVTPHRTFRLTVTPESDADVKQPSHDAVFSADVERPE